MALLETATEQVLATGSAKAWVALTDRRALVVAALSEKDVFVHVAEAGAVAHRARLGRDELAVGALTLRCPLLRRGAELKQMARLAAADPVERLRAAAAARLEEEEPAAAAALAAAALARGQDSGLLSLRTRALVALERFEDLGPTLTALVVADPELATWADLERVLLGSPRALWLLYQAADEACLAHVARARLAGLRERRPTHPLLAELAVRMDADDGLLEAGLDRVAAWHDEGAVDAETLLAACETLGRAGLDGEHLHRRRALALSALGRHDEALAAVREALGRERSRQSLRLEAELLLGRDEPARALPPLEELLAAGADDAWTQGRLGDALEALGRLDEAMGAKERALERLLEAPADAQAEAGARQALARTHGRLAAAAEGPARDLHAAAVALLEAGKDWAARLAGAPRLLLGGSALEARLEVIAARTLPSGPATARLVFEEAVVEGKELAAGPEAAPPPLEGWTAGRWPAPEEEDEAVHADRKTARARYPLGGRVALSLPAGLGRGRHECGVSMTVPAEAEPSYRGERVRAALLLVVSPLGARFELPTAPRHDWRAPPRPEAREGTGKARLRVSVPEPAFCFGRPAVVEVDGQAAGSREVESIEVALVATERMRAPHRGERVVETLLWTFPVFEYERESGRLLRALSIHLPDRGAASGQWTWFELGWALRVRLLRKERPEAVAEVPVVVRHPAAPRSGLADPARAQGFDADEATSIDARAPDPRLADPGSGEQTAVGPPPALVTEDGVTLDIDIDAAAALEPPATEPPVADVPDPGTDWGEG